MLLVALLASIPLPANAAPLEKVANSPRYDRWLRFDAARSVARDYLRRETNTDGGYGADLYACKRRSRLVVDCEGDYLQKTCKAATDDEGVIDLTRCAGPVTTSTVSVSLRVRAVLWMAVARVR